MAGASRLAYLGTKAGDLDEILSEQHARLLYFRSVGR